MASPAALFSWQVYNQVIKLGLASSAAGSFISPLSLYIALVLVLNGAGPGSPTYRELWHLLNQNQTQLPASIMQSQLATAEAAFNRQTAALLSGLLAQSSINGTQIGIANGIWTMKQQVLKEYAVSMWQQYKAPVKTVNSTDPINIWAREKTGGRIQSAVPQNLKFSVLVTNAVYFKGNWEYAFDPKETQPQPFQMLSNRTQKTVEVPMMFQKFTARDMTGERQVFYANISGLFKAVRLPYRHSNISAVALLPDKAKYGLDVDAAAVDLAELGLLSTARWRTMYSVGQLNLQLPKFTSKTDQIPLKKALQALNVTTPFNDVKANFSRMSAEPLYISDILQSTFIQVDEVGTEAAAVTTAVMVTTAYNPSVIELVFDRPFIFVLLDDVSGAVLFQGTIKDPSKS